MSDQRQDAFTINPVLFMLTIAAFVALLGLTMIPTPSETQVVVSSILICGVVLWMIYEGYVYANRRRLRNVPARELEHPDPRRPGLAA